MKFNEIFSYVIMLLLLLAISISFIGLLFTIIYGLASEYVIKLGVLILYLTPLASILMLFIKAITDRDYKMVILIVVILAILILNVYYLGLPEFS